MQDDMESTGKCYPAGFVNRSRQAGKTHHQNPKKVAAYTPSPKEFQALEHENDKLKKLLGEKDLEIAILRDLVKKGEPRLSDKIEIADKWIARGCKAAMVLRIVGVSEATYYYRKKHFKQERVYNGGRPIPGFSLDHKQHPVSDEQIKEWLMELISGEEATYGYRKLTLCLKRQYGLIINKKKSIPTVSGTGHPAATTPEANPISPKAGEQS